MSVAALERKLSRAEPTGVTPSHARRRLARTFRLVPVLAALVLATPTAVFLLYSLRPEYAVLKDFGQEYLLARAIVDGSNPYAPIRDLAARYLSPTGLLDKPFPTPHPPSVGVLFLPFLLVDYVAAVRIWFGVQIACLVASIGLLIRQKGSPFRLRSAPLIALAALSWIPVGAELAMGQLTSALLLIVVTSQLALSHRRNALAGALIGISLLVKPLAWPLLLPLMLRRRWSSLCAAGVVTFMGLALPGLRVGIDAPLQYVTTVLPSVSAQYATETTNISFWTIGPRLFQGVQSGALAGTPPLVASPDAARLLGAAIPVAVLLLAVAWLVRSRPPLPIALGVMTCVSIAVNPISWQYYLVLLLLPAAQLLNWLHIHRYPRIPTVLAAVVAMALYLDGGTWRDLARVASTPWMAPDQPDAPIAALLTLGPSLAAGALGLLLAYVSKSRSGREPTFS